MTPGNLPLALYVGDTYSHALTFTDSPTADPEDLAHRRNLSGNTYLAQIRKSSGSTSVLAQFAVDTTDAATGVLVISLTADETELVPSGVCAWDLQETDGPTVSTVLAGQVTVTGDVSREGDLPPTVPSSGASGAVLRVEVSDPINFDTQLWAITAADDVAQTFAIAGDHRALLPDGSQFVVVGSSNNDGTYTITSTAFAAGHTTITTDEAPVDDTADGSLTNLNTYGAVIYTPVVGEVLWDIEPLVVVAFNGTTPFTDFALDAGFVNNGERGIYSGVANGGVVPLSAADVTDGDWQSCFAGLRTQDANAVTRLSTKTVPNSWRAPQFISTDPLLACVSTNGQRGSPPVGGTTGQLVWRLIIGTDPA